MKLLKLLIVSVGILATSVFAVETITIAASPVPHAQILNFVKPILKKQGIDLQVTEFTDYIQPNLLVAQKQMDANYFQHIPYLTQFNKERGTNLVNLVSVHVEPMGIYTASEAKLKSFTQSKNIKQLPQGLIVGVPSDTTNEGRALLLLQKNGLIQIKSGVAYPTKDDITGNPYKLQIKELDPALLPRVIKSQQIDLAVINSNYALQANLNPLKDAVFIEDKNSPYVNIIAVRPDEVNMPKMKILAKVMNSPEVKQYILQTYKGAIVPAF